MSFLTLPIGLVAALLLQQPPSPQVKIDSPQEPAGTACSCSHRPQKPKTTTPKCIDSEKASCEYRLGIRYLELGRLGEAYQHCSSAMALDSTNPAPVQCSRVALERIQTERRAAVHRGVELATALMDDGAYAAAQDDLNTLKSDERQAAAKYGPNEGTAKEIDDGISLLAQTQKREWPVVLPSSAGLREWLPGVVSLIGRIIAFLVISLLVYVVLLIARFIYRRVRWRGVSDVGRSIFWSVSSIADSTKQSAAGALIDALNVYYNPLFQRLYTSSFLAAPPSLIPVGTTGDPSIFMWRNFLTDVLGLPSDTVRVYLSNLIEAIDIQSFARHRFCQVTAYENINLKVGFVDASLGAIANSVRNWWKKGWPSVVGSVLFEKINGKTFASVRLICNFGFSRNDGEAGVVSNDVDMDQSQEGLKAFFSEERTLSVFASTQVDESADAVSLASQRAAFRLLYRLAKRPADPGLAVAASSYRQGVRLLNTVL